MNKHSDTGLNSNHADMFQPRMLHWEWKRVVNSTLREVRWYGRTNGSSQPGLGNIPLVRLYHVGTAIIFGRADDHTMRTIGVFTSAEIAVIAASDAQ
jgi:hypothetical protein